MIWPLVKFFATFSYFLDEVMVALYGLSSPFSLFNIEIRNSPACLRKKKFFYSELAFEINVPQVLQCLPMPSVQPQKKLFHFMKWTL
jgi:hypothetical protein